MCRTASSERGIECLMWLFFHTISGRDQNHSVSQGCRAVSMLLATNLTAVIGEHGIFPL